MLATTLQSRIIWSKHRRVAVVWGPGSRGTVPGWMTVGECRIKEMRYLQNEPWRLLGVYKRTVPHEYLLDDIRHWRAQTGMKG